MSFVFSGIITYSLNRIPRLKAACLVKAWERDDIDSICSEAITNFKLISISLDNRKVYIGLVFDSLEPDKEGYLTILPFYSGHRDIENLEMVLVKKYTSVYNLLERLNDQPPGQEDEELESQLKDYRIVIPRERIATLNISANSLYKEMEEPSKQI